MSYAPVEIPAWYDDALCAQIGGDLWFAEKGGSNRLAKSVCRACPAMQACRSLAIADDSLVGVWGATSTRDRAAIRAEVQEVAA